MKHITENLVMIAALLLALTPRMATAQQPSPDTMSVVQARRVIISGLSHDIAFLWMTHLKHVDPNSFHFAPDRIDFDVVASHGTRHFTFDLTTLPEVKVDCIKDYCKVIPTAKYGSFLSNVVWDDSKTMGWRTRCSQECVGAAQTFAAALNSLRQFATTPHADTTGDFHQQAAAWRALANKPPLPEKVRVYRLLAEDALKNRKPEEAFKYYELGLQQYPTWPQGWFNAALIAGELGYYAEAAEHMQRYLELVPDAKDAQSAHDQIAIWQYKAKQSSTN
jgi:hypothetical protein